MNIVKHYNKICLVLHPRPRHRPTITTTVAMRVMMMIMMIVEKVFVAVSP